MTELFEIWKPVDGYQGLYEVSNLGRVRSVDRFRKQKNNSKAPVKGKLLKPSLGKNGYLRVALSKNGTVKFKNIHRLVSEAFIQNPNNLPCVNHKDENKTNNKASNLEWCTKEYNNNYGTKPKRCGEASSKKVFQFSTAGVFIKEWSSTMEIQRCLGYANTFIGRCCRGLCDTAYGYVWKYA